jgi:hypothetical protein
MSFGRKTTGRKCDHGDAYCAFGGFGQLRVAFGLDSVKIRPAESPLQNLSAWKHVQMPGSNIRDRP